MIKTILFASLVMSFGLAYAADFSDVELTSEQCEDWVYTESIRLSNENKTQVRESCAQRYSSENAMGNCTAFEGEDFIKYLEKLAQTQCNEPQE